MSLFFHNSHPFQTMRWIVMGGGDAYAPTTFAFTKAEIAQPNNNNVCFFSFMTAIRISNIKK